MNITATPSPYLNLSAVISGLREALGGWGAKGFLNQVLMFLLYRRLFVIGARMERLVERFQAGRLWRRAAGHAVGPKVLTAPAARACGADEPVWPRRFGWLVRLASYQAAGYGSQLRAVLETPEMAALLEAAPQAVAILRPLCRMLAIETALLRPRPTGDRGEITPGEAACGQDGAVARKRVRVPRGAVDFGRIPLPRGTLAAARRQGVRNR